MTSSALVACGGAVADEGPNGGEPADAPSALACFEPDPAYLDSGTHCTQTGTGQDFCRGSLTSVTAWHCDDENGGPVQPPLNSCRIVGIGNGGTDFLCAWLRCEQSSDSRCGDPRAAYRCIFDPSTVRGQLGPECDVLDSLDDDAGITSVACCQTR